MITQSELCVCVCVYRVHLWVFPTAGMHDLKRKVGDSLRKQLQGGETVSRMGRVEWWMFSYLIFYGMCLISKAETKESLFIYSFTYSFSFVQWVFLSIHGTTSCAEKRRVKKTTALGSCHMGISGGKKSEQQAGGNPVRPGKYFLMGNLS